MQLVKNPASYLEQSDFDSVQDFIERGLSFAILSFSNRVSAAF
jgi:hypothetical protein